MRRLLMIRPVIRQLYRSPAALFFAIIAILLLWFVLRTASAYAIWSTLQKLNVLEIILLLAVNVMVFWTFAGRWWFFLHAQGYTVSYRKLLAYRLTAFSISYFTPGPHFGGEPYQVYATIRWHAVPRRVAIAAVTLDKLLELLFSFTFLLAGAIFSLPYLQSDGSLHRQALLLACLMLAALLLLLISWALQKHPISALARQLSHLLQPAVAATPVVTNRQASQSDRPRPHTKANRFQRVRHAANAKVRQWQALVFSSEEQAIWLCRRAPRTLLWAVGVTMLSWIAMVGEYWLLTSLLDLNLSLGQALSAFLAARIAILLPMPAGLGALEASQVFALVGLGLTPATGIGLSIVIRLRDVILGIAGFWIAGHTLWRAGLLAGLDVSANIVDAPIPGELNPGIVHGRETTGIRDK